ncbi:unnamed protein product [Penicillium salamii]|uniref:Uncharacterized protein n=1 Tax=Penicillium salamii TaxID=1612424 RepID=A0A9W4J891_9EURO|nr:unnamed protein product [Penicillium salamii]CAG8168921.1 unnamed protein product [Penicillium salamii]CAG8247249.1 unnamed protein product [Penicillium salamii]CAG8306393.1 unnamed protein product [Penicillium salamii]CAG8373107.1 unnamed protein product [Penicillium salamii]
MVDTSTTTSLAATVPSLSYVQKMFSLTQILDVEFDTVAPAPLPQDLSISPRSIV